MDAVWLAMLIAMALAWANGANDNIKGAATLVGCGLRSASQAIVIATAATALGGLVSLLLGQGLVAAFSGNGFLPDELAGTPSLLVPVGLGAAVTVGIATWRGLPVSTTHALIGALLGAGLMAAPENVQFGPALGALVMPLVLLPLSAIMLALSTIPLARRMRAHTEQLPDACLCTELEANAYGETVAAREIVRLGTAADPACQPVAAKAAMRVSPVRALDTAHVLSALGVSFARGLNDTPKIAAIGLAGAGSGAEVIGIGVVLAMVLGGLLAAHRVADTMAWRVTRMDPAEGLGGNLVTSGLVLAASALALPVSTTHVSCGALFGIAAGNRGGQSRNIVTIALAWVLTLPLGAVLGAFFYACSKGVLS